MLALYRCRRQGETLRVYERLRRTLADELGVDPAPPLRELHQRILTADPGPDSRAPGDGSLVGGPLGGGPLGDAAEEPRPGGHRAGHGDAGASAPSRRTRLRGPGRRPGRDRRAARRVGAEPGPGRRRRGRSPASASPAW
ncbi:BTAD domain-containing putative transcriptional regulator [Streptomyces andamanensis]|uniref:BTAD domain-containing putative transcriptional regulator n=1 Tax=Streptomyces andamanensis TaxID=1565035 RepID=A0ABV8TFQ0_9ACTN